MSRFLHPQGCREDTPITLKSLMSQRFAIAYGLHASMEDAHRLWPCSTLQLWLMSAELTLYSMLTA